MPLSSARRAFWLQPTAYSLQPLVLLPFPRIAPANADEDALHAPRARFEFACGGLRRHAATGDEIPHGEGVVRRRSVCFAKHLRIEPSAQRHFYHPPQVNARGKDLPLAEHRR